MNFKKKLVYIGVFLTEQSQKHLLKQCKPRYNNIYADHVTLWFILGQDDDFSDKYHGLIGMEVLFKAVREIYNGKCQTIILSHIEHLMAYRSVGRRAHITLSSIVGVEPYYSNELIESDYQTRVSSDYDDFTIKSNDLDIVLEGTIEGKVKK